MGSTLQMRVPASGGLNKSMDGQMLWMNPGRDIAHSFPDLLKRVLEILDTPDFNGRGWFLKNGGTDAELQMIGQVLTTYVHKVVDLEVVRTQQQALVESGYLELPERSKILMGWAMQLVMFAAFFHGYREMLSGRPSVQLQGYHIAPERRSFLGRWLAYFEAEWFGLLRWAQLKMGYDPTRSEAKLD